MFQRLFFPALIAALMIPSVANAQEAGHGPETGYTVSGPHRLATPCHRQYYRLPGDRTIYVREHCPGAPALDGIGMPTGKPPINMNRIKEATRAKVRKDGTIVLY